MNKFVVYSGNNPEVIRDALLKRGNWEQANISSLLIIYLFTYSSRFLKQPKMLFIKRISFGGLAITDTQY